MDQYAVTFIIEYLVFFIAFLLSFTPFANKYFASKKYSVLILFILLLQVISAWLLKKEIGDVMLFSGAGGYLRKRIDFYWIDADHGQYPFFPFLLFVYAAINWITCKIPTIIFSFILKLLMLIPVHYLGKKIEEVNQAQSVKQARKIRARFLLNPITYAVIFFHGQTDIILIAFYIASLMIWTKAQTVKQSFISGLLFACSVASKTWSGLFLPLILLGKQTLINKMIFTITTIIFLLSNIYIYILFMNRNTSFDLILEAILSPGGSIGNWGIGLFLNNFFEFTIQYRFVLLMLPLIVFTLIYIRKFTLLKRSLLLVLSLYIILLNWGIQYIFWIIPFSYMLYSWIDRKAWKLFLITSIPYTFVSYLYVIVLNQTFVLNIQRLLGLSVWITCIWWFYRQAVKVKV